MKEGTNSCATALFMYIILRATKPQPLARVVNNWTLIKQFSYCTLCSLLSTTNLITNYNEAVLTN